MRGLRALWCLFCQKQSQFQESYQQMSDPRREEEQTLLGDEWLKAGGQVLKLGYFQSSFIIFFLLRIHVTVGDTS